MMLEIDEILLLLLLLLLLNAFFTYRSVQSIACTGLLVTVAYLLSFSSTTFTANPIVLTVSSSLVWSFFPAKLNTLHIVLRRSICLNRHYDTVYFSDFTSQW
jgi:hypothetical protein